MSFLIRTAFCLFALSTLASAGPNSAALYDYPLSILRGDNSLSSLKGEARAILVFQPRCGWCALQARTIYKMKKEGLLSDRYLAVGINGRRPALMREAIKLKLPSFQSNRAFVKAAALDKSSPVILIVDREGKLLKKLKGYQDETVLSQIDQILRKL